MAASGVAWVVASSRTSSALAGPEWSAGWVWKGLAMLPSDWASLVALLDGRPDADPMTRVHRLCQVCVQATDVSGVALSIAFGGQRSTVSATDELSDRLEDLQATYSDGPSVEAARDGWRVFAPDLTDGAERRWSWFRAAAVDAGARAMFALPVRTGALRFGALTLYRVTAGALTAEQVRDAKLLADAAAVLLSLNQPGEKTAEAFMWVVGDRSRFRPEVHQAVGATMVDLGVDAREAFARICAHAFAENRSVAEVSADIMANRVRLSPDGA